MQISPKVSETLGGFDRFTINGYMATRRKARVAHVCAVCGNQIEVGERYFELTPNGAGIGGFLKPARIHIEHLLGYFIKLRGKGEKGREGNLHSVSQ